jgi:predicted nucleic acid-binding protein
MIVISDASPILNLAVVGKLNLLPQLYKSVIVPQSVFEEVTQGGKDRPGAMELTNAPWISVLPCNNRHLFEELSTTLDIGEAEAIALAVEINADLLLIDEKKGRETARRYHVRVTGLLGVLLQAKRKGMLKEIRSVLDEMVVKANFRVSKELYEQIVVSAGEIKG